MWPVIATVVSRLKDFSRSQAVTCTLRPWFYGKIKLF